LLINNKVRIFQENNFWSQTNFVKHAEVMTKSGLNFINLLFETTLLNNISSPTTKQIPELIKPNKTNASKNNKNHKFTRFFCFSI